MSPVRFLLGFGLLTAAVIVVAIVQVRATASLRRAAVAGQMGERARHEIQNEHDALAAQQPTTAELEEVRDDLLALETETAALENQRADLQRATLHAMRRAPPRNATLRDPPLRSSPEATIQSVVRAITDGEADELAALIDFDGDAHTEAEEFFASLPDDVRTQFGGAATLIAHVMTAKTRLDGASASVDAMIPAGPDDLTLRMKLQRPDGLTRTATLQLHRTADGWKLRVPAKVIEGYRALVTGFVPASITSAPVP